MKQKMINVLNWLKSRKTAFLSCLLVVCVGCTVLAVSRSNKTAKANVYNRDETAFQVQTYLPPVLFFTSSTYSSSMGMVCPLTFYIRSEGLAFSTGAEYRYIEFANMSTPSDFSTYFYRRDGDSYALVINDVRAYIDMFTNSSTWNDFYFRCLKKEFTLSVQYINRVIYDSTLPDASKFHLNNSAFYRFTFTHKDNPNYNYTFGFYLSSLSRLPSSSYGQFKLTNVKGLSDDYQIAYYYTVTTSIINVSSDKQYEQGYNDGKSAGLLEGEQKGYLDGKNVGLSEGEKIGYDKGLNEKLQNITPWQAIVDGVNSFVNIEVLPGVKLSVILSIGFGLILMGVVIKVFLGG